MPQILDRNMCAIPQRRSTDYMAQKLWSGRSGLSAQNCERFGRVINLVNVGCEKKSSDIFQKKVWM